MKHIKHENMGKSDLGWLKSLFHFSFAEYYNPQNMQFGMLRVVNDDLVAPNKGFELHPHRDMEIISYVVEGELTHADSMGNQRTLKRGEVQYMSAGKGVLHSEHNRGNETLRFLQIWILPDQKGHQPQYGDRQLEWSQRVNHWLKLAEGKSSSEESQIENAIINRDIIALNQDANLYVTELHAPNQHTLNIQKGRMAYLILIEGEAELNDIDLKTRDAVELTEETIVIKTNSKAHILLIELAKN